MKIIAIFNRDRVAPKLKSIFILTEDGEFGEFKPETKYAGHDSDGNVILEDTGNFEFWKEDPLIGNRWDLKQALAFGKYFGWDLEKEFNVS
jgi:hypothetical protein